jgi:type IV secretory pathway VirB2 component (pilin)
MSKQAIAITMVNQSNNQRLVAMAIFAISVYFIFFTPAYAASAIYSILCNVILTIIVDVGRGIATLAVIVLGISALLGRATWAQGLTIMAGIAIIFGAPGIALSFATSAATGLPGLGQLFSGGVGNIASLLACTIGV